MTLFLTRLTPLLFAIAIVFGCAQPEAGTGTIRFQVDSDCPSCVCEDYCLDQIDVQLWREGEPLPSATKTGACGDELIFNDLLAGSAFSLHVFLSRDGAPILTGVSAPAIVLKDSTQDVTVSIALSDESAMPSLAAILTDPLVLVDSEQISVSAEFDSLGTGTGQPELLLDETPLETVSVDGLLVTANLSADLLQDSPGSQPQLQGAVCSIGSDPLTLRVLAETPSLQDRDALVCGDEPLRVASSFGDLAEPSAPSGLLVGCPSTTGWELWRLSDTSCLAFEQRTLPEEPAHVSANEAGDVACVLSTDPSRIHHLDFTSSDVRTYTLETDVEAVQVTAQGAACFAITTQSGALDDRQVVQLDVDGQSAVTALGSGRHMELLRAGEDLWVLSQSLEESDDYLVLHFATSSSIVTQYPIADCPNAHSLGVASDGVRFAVACEDPSRLHVFDGTQEATLSWPLEDEQEEVLGILWDQRGDVLFARTQEAVLVGQIDDTVEPAAVEELTRWAVPRGVSGDFFFTFARDDRIFLEGSLAGSFRSLRSYLGVSTCLSQ